MLQNINIIYLFINLGASTLLSGEGPVIFRVCVWWGHENLLVLAVIGVGVISIFIVALGVLILLRNGGHPFLDTLWLLP